MQCYYGVVVDLLSKYAHFIVITHPYTASHIADIFMKEIFCLHGMPRSIVSDRDPIFISHSGQPSSNYRVPSYAKAQHIILSLMANQR